MKSYLGDGVYAESTQFGDVVLTTENGIAVTNRIVLESPVLQALYGFVAQARARASEPELPFVFVPAVRCPTHGHVELTSAQYDEQMNKPDSLWYCPKCTERADWDGNE